DTVPTRDGTGTARRGVDRDEVRGREGGEHGRGFGAGTYSSFVADPSAGCVRPQMPRRPAPGRGTAPAVDPGGSRAGAGVGSPGGDGSPGQQGHAGTSTASMTWMTPLVAATSAADTVTSLPAASVRETAPSSPTFTVK